MPTFDDPRKDSAEAYQALRGLAHASIAFTDPADTYPVIGDLLGDVRILRQVFDQVAGAHVAYRGRAHNDFGDQAAGATSALATADNLHQAGTLMDAVEKLLDAASQHSGRIAWHPAAQAEPAPTRWISVVFLDGAEADKVLDLIEASGTDTAIEHLAAYDYGDETTQAALENGYVYARPPDGTLDRSTTRDDYTLVHSPFLGYVSLYREFATTPDDAPEATGVHPLVNAMIDHHAKRQEPSAAARSDRGVRGQAAGVDWFAARPGTSSVPGRGLSL